MTIAERKKQENISEYIIHMYQTEDLIRAFEFDLNQITEYVIKHIPGDENEKKQLILWYAEVITQMSEEGIKKDGHLKSTQEIVTRLQDLKNILLTTDQEFITIWKTAQKTVESNQDKTGTNEIQVCLNGIYGLLLLRLNGQPVSDEILKQADQFGNVLSYLSYKYKQQKFTTPN
ncbi:MAG: DUF4924 family protein [Bacteroidota bacterium]